VTNETLKQVFAYEYVDMQQTYLLIRHTSTHKITWCMLINIPQTKSLTIIYLPPVTSLATVHIYKITFETSTKPEPMDIMSRNWPIRYPSSQ